MKIILTGASGFLGKHIAHYFANEELITIGRTSGSVIAHLEREIPELPQADLVIHAAGKAHLRPLTSAEAQDFYNVNVLGTKNLLKVLSDRNKLPDAFVFISTVAVYGLDTGVMIKEDSPLSAKDPYGRSKIVAEDLVRKWCKMHEVKCVIFRLPLIAGSNPPGNLRSMINGIRRGYYFNISGGKARKSMVMASSIPEAILPAIKTGGTYHLTDGLHPSFAELSACIAAQLGKKNPISLYGPFAHLIAIFGSFFGRISPLNKKNYKKMINDLTFDDSSARVDLDWQPLTVISHFKI